MVNRLLEIPWDDVRLLSVEGNEIVVTLKDETRRITFTTAKELNDAFGEWCNVGSGKPNGSLLAKVGRGLDGNVQ